METIFEKLNLKLSGKVKQNIPLGQYTTLKIGGPAEYYFEATTIEDIQKAVLAAKDLGIEFTLLGGGTNVLISSTGVAGLVVRNLSNSIQIKGLKGKYEKGIKTGVIYVEVDSGVNMNRLVRFTIEEGLGGLEMHLGLPGTVGGAIYMNSKWTKPLSYVGDAVYQATIIDKNNQIKTVPKNYFNFDYDYSILQDSYEICLSVTFALQPKSVDELWQTANQSMEYRKITQPSGVKTAGCTFRNLEMTDVSEKTNNSKSAGYLIDQVGLKGFEIGSAMISKDHANFFINQSHATSDDMVKLIEIAKTKVHEKFNVDLKEEIVKVGKFS